VVSFQNITELASSCHSMGKFLFLFFNVLAK
jgi:hypothetical protein